MTRVTNNAVTESSTTWVLLSSQGSGPSSDIAEMIDRGFTVRSRPFAFRRTAVIGVVWVAAMGVLVAVSPAASGQTAVDPGTGNAYAQGYKIDPRSGQLSFGITYGMALAGHQNTVAIGEARSVDLGVIGTTLAGEGCDGGDPTLPKDKQPQPVVVRSTDDNKNRTETEYAVEKHAEATNQPYAESIATTTAVGDPAAVLLGSTRSRSLSGVVDGKRVASAITDVANISFGAGAVVIKGLHWGATYQSAPDEAISGSFTIEGVQSAGKDLPIKDAADGLAQANAALEPLGISLDPPQVRNESGIVFVDPLKIGIVPSKTRDGISGPLLNAASPVREQLVDALIKADCGNASYITIADIALGSVTGAGSLSIELGGVTATSDELGETSFLGALSDYTPSLPPISGTSGGASSLPAITGSSGGTSLGGVTLADSPTTEPQTVDTTPAPTGGDETALGDVTPISGSRGGPLLGVGLGGLLLLTALAEGDRRKMRQAQRSVPMEVMA